MMRRRASRAGGLPSPARGGCSRRSLAAVAGPERRGEDPAAARRCPPGPLSSYPAARGTPLRGTAAVATPSAPGLWPPLPWPGPQKTMGQPGQPPMRRPPVRLAACIMSHASGGCPCSPAWRHGPPPATEPDHEAPGWARWGLPQSRGGGWGAPLGRWSTSQTGRSGRPSFHHGTRGRATADAIGPVGPSGTCRRSQWAAGRRPAPGATVGGALSGGPTTRLERAVPLYRAGVAGVGGRWSQPRVADGMARRAVTPPHASTASTQSGRWPERPAATPSWTGRRPAAALACNMAAAHGGWLGQGRVGGPGQVVRRAASVSVHQASGRHTRVSTSAEPWREASPAPPLTLLPLAERAPGRARAAHGGRARFANARVVARQAPLGSAPRGGAARRLGPPPMRLLPGPLAEQPLPPPETAS
jgi:hypothetical protein